MQVDTLSTEKLEQSGATTLSDYLANEPGVDVKTTGGAGNGAINIRGVSTGDQTISTVSTYIDDVAIGSRSPSGFPGSPTGTRSETIAAVHSGLLCDEPLRSRRPRYCIPVAALGG